VIGRESAPGTLPPMPPTTPDVNNLLPRLQRWYVSNCDGDWEHSWGVTITTLDNPGWHVKVNLEGTRMEGKAFNAFEHGVGYDLPEDPDNPEAAWIVCRVADNAFEAAGGPHQLAEIIATFLNWAEQK
jgi:hypothetical protein